MQSKFMTKIETQRREITAVERRDQLIGIDSKINRPYISFLQQTRYIPTNTLFEKRKKRTHSPEEDYYNPYIQSPKVD